MKQTQLESTGEETIGEILEIIPCTAQTVELSISSPNGGASIKINLAELLNALSI